MIDRELRDVLGGCEPSSARTKGRSYPVLMGAAEDAALQRFASRSATNPPPDHPRSAHPGARDVPITHLASSRSARGRGTTRSEGVPANGPSKEFRTRAGTSLRVLDVERGSQPYGRTADSPR